MSSCKHQIRPAFGIPRSITAVALLLAGLVLSGHARAQQVAATTGKTDQETGPTLEQITVTATRRQESIQHVPISINAFSEKDLQQAHIESISDLAAVTPGLQYATPNGFGDTIDTIAIRGMNTQVGASVVGIYLDDTPLQVRLAAVGNVGDIFPMVFDLQRVEVDRGPQGTLFGAGSEAGVIRYIPNSPSLTDFSSYSRAEVDTTQGGAPSSEIGAAAGGPVIEDKLGFRASVWYRQDGGYTDRIDPFTGAVVDHNANADGKLAFRTAFAYQPTDGVLITPSILVQRTDNDDTSRFYGNYGSPYSTDAQDGTFLNGALLPAHSRDRLTLPSIKLQVHLPFADLTADASYLNRRLDLYEDLSRYYGVFLGGFGNPIGPAFPTSPSDAIPDITGQAVRGFTEEVRLASNRPDAALKWVAGIFVDHQTQVDYQSLTYAPVDATGPFYAVSEHTTDDQVAAFGQADYRFASKWTATLGLRVARARTLQLDYNGTGPFNAGEPAVAVTGVSQTPVTPKASLAYQVNTNNMVYTSIAKGFRMGGGNAPFPAGCGIVPPYKSDYVWSYEVGSKNQLFGGRVQSDASAFYVDWYNIQLLEGASCGVAYTANGGKGVTEGFDWALKALLTENLRADLDIGYTNAYYTKTVYSFGVPIVIEGNKMYIPPQVNPPWDVNVAATYDFPLGDDRMLSLRGEFQYHSRNPGPFITQNTSPVNYAPLEVPNSATHLWNARLGYTHTSVELTVFVDNLLNSHPALDAFELPPASNLLTYDTFRPRTVGVSVSYSH